MFEVTYVNTDDPAVQTILGLQAEPVQQEDTRLTDEASETVRDYRKGVKATSKAGGYVGTLTKSAKGAPIGHEPFTVFVNRVLTFRQPLRSEVADPDGRSARQRHRQLGRAKSRTGRSTRSRMN